MNRDTTSWTVDGHQLPQYGYYADLGTVTGAIEAKDGVIVEWCKSPEIWYINARPVVPTGLPASVKLKSLTPTDGRNFEVALEWNVFGPIGEDLTVYIHFMDSEGKILFQADSRPQPPTNEWQGIVVTKGYGAVPDDIKPGTALSLQTGLWKPGDRRRPLQNNVHGDASVRLATVQIEEDNSQITGFDVNSIPAEHLEVLA